MANKKAPREKKIPQRRCVGCGEHRDKSALLRVVRSPEGAVSVDRTGKLPGRGAYLCRDVKCLEKAVKSHRLQTNLVCDIPQDVYDTLAKGMSDDGT